MESISSIYYIITNISISFYSISIKIILELLLLLFLLFSSALISGSEVAFFSFSPNNILTLKNNKAKTNNKIIKLIENPERLLATILITNNFVNIGIIILSTFITASLINFSEIEWLKFVIEAVVITFIILLFGEIIPKVYANQYNIRFAKIMAYPLFYLTKILFPFSSILMKSTFIVSKLFMKKEKMSIKDISDAIDIASDNIITEKEMLKGAVKFGKTEVKEIMTPRIDVVSIEIKEKFSKVKQIIMESGFSRIPIFENSLDNILGVLYVKDLIKYIDKNADFNWNKLLKKPYFIPETKKIDDLLQEFRNKKIHIALVSDEYGGISGIISLEDVLEEIIGEIQDEFDGKDENYKIINENIFIFEGKFPLKDFYKIIKINENFFDEIKSDSETIAGVVLNIVGEFPKKGARIRYKNLIFSIEAIDKRRIREIKIEKK